MERTIALLLNSSSPCARCSVLLWIVILYLYSTCTYLTAEKVQLLIMDFVRFLAKYCHSVTKSLAILSCLKSLLIFLSMFYIWFTEVTTKFYDTFFPFLEHSALYSFEKSCYKAAATLLSLCYYCKIVVKKSHRFLALISLDNWLNEAPAFALAFIKIGDR